MTAGLGRAPLNSQQQHHQQQDECIQFPPRFAQVKNSRKGVAAAAGARFARLQLNAKLNEIDRLQCADFREVDVA